MAPLEAAAEAEQMAAEAEPMAAEAEPMVVDVVPDGQTGTELPPMPLGPHELEPLLVKGSRVNLTLFGMKENDVFALEAKAKKGPKQKAEMVFSIALDVLPGKPITLTTIIVDALANYELDQSQFSSSMVKVATVKSGIAAIMGSSEYVDISRRLLLELSAESTIELTAYLPVHLLASARKGAARAMWEVFPSEASKVIGKEPSKTTLEMMIGHKLSSINGAMGIKSVAASTSMLADVENFLKRHISTNFATFAVEMEAARMKGGGCGVKATAGAAKRALSDEATFEHALQGHVQPMAKRTRHDFSALGKQFIEQYLASFVQLSGNSSGRKQLIQGILDTATTREEELDSSEWTSKGVHKALANMLAKKNAADKAAAAATVGTA